jgi:glucose uptake protein GlcU
MIEIKQIKNLLFLIMLVALFSLMSTSPVLADANSTTGVEFTNPLGSVTSISDLLQKILNNLREIVGVLAIIFIIIGGVMYMMSAGNENMMKKGKNTVTAAIIGLAIAVAAPAFLNQIYEITGKSGSGITLKTIAENFLTFLLSIVGIIAIISLIIGGMMYMTAAGSEKQIDSAKKLLWASIIGIIVCFGALVIVRQVASLVGG